MDTQGKKELPGALRSALYLAGGALGLFVLLRYVVPWTAPFIIALALTLLIEPLVKVLITRLRFPRAAASGLCSLLVLGLLALLTTLLAVRLISEGTELLLRAPAFLESLAPRLDGFSEFVKNWARSAPPGLTEMLLPMLDSLPGELARLAGTLSGLALSALSSAAKKMPEIFLFTVTSGIGLYFLSSEYPEIRAFLKRQVPLRYRARAAAAVGEFIAGVGSWLKAQLILTLITFFELLLALSLLRAEYVILMAALISAVDLLPVLGAGTVLLPWAAASALAGDLSFALGLTITYAAVTLLRSLIQAKLIGDQLGLRPIVSLFSMYVGFRAFGITGMIALPILVIVVKQLNDRGILTLWRPAPRPAAAESRINYEKPENHRSKLL